MMAAALSPVEDRPAGQGKDNKYRWVVMQRRPLSSLPRWKRWLVRQVYKVVNWQTADGEELQAICDTESIARAICGAGGPNWFYHRLPMNVSLPAETCTLDGVRFPYSDAAAFYEAVGKARANEQVLICPLSGEICQQHQSLPMSDLVRVAKEVEKLNAIQST